MPSLPDTDGSLWRESYPKSLYPHLRENIEVDVVIVGAGITGLTAAYLLTKAGQSVAVLDKDTIGGGTTGRTTGKVTSQHGLIYTELYNRIGKKFAKLYAEANQAAVEQVGMIVKKEKIDCGWHVEDNYVFTTDPKRIKQFEKEAITATALNLPASFETILPLPFNVKAAVKFSGQGKIVSQQYLNGLANAVKTKGGHIYEHSNVISIKDGSSCRVKTKKAIITAKNIVVATNVPTLPLMARGGYCLLEYPTESYIVAAQVNDNLSGMYISPDRGHYSILPINFNDHKYVLVGGGGHLSGVRGNTKARYRRLADYANKHFDVKTITHKWSDRDYTAYDEVPLIGKLYPWSKHLYVATAFNKWGLSSGTAAAIMLTDMIVGKQNPWAPVFTPQRLRPITSIPRAVSEQSKQIFHF